VRAFVITPAGVIGTLLLAAAIVAFIRLGFWQIGRLEERRALNAAVAARLDATPIADAAALEDTAGIIYRTATVRGTYDIERSVVLPGRSHRGVPGVYLLSPLRLDGRADAVLVNRGWVPAPDAATIDVADFDVVGEVTVHGLVLPFPSAGQSLAPRQRVAAPADGEFRRVWFTVDEALLRGQFPYPLLPAAVQELSAAAGGAAARSGSAAAAVPMGEHAAGAAGIDRAAAARVGSRYPARLEPPPLDEGPHLGYALQWFSFAIVGIIGWVALMLRSRHPPRVIPPPPPPLVAAIALLTFAWPAGAQLRPVEPLEWRVFDEHVWLVGSAGASLLLDQPATLAGTRGRLLEAGNYALVFRSGSMALSFSGTALWRLTDEAVERAPVGAARPSSGEPRQDAGRAMAATLVRVSRSRWPADVVLRFGTTIPTTSDESGLDRDRTDFFATLGARYRRGRLTLHTEQGVGINGTIHDHYPQSDVWIHAFGVAYGEPGAAGIVELVGHQDGRSRVVRGNEDQHELRLGFDLGGRHWLRARYVRGLSEYSVRDGVRISAGLTLDRRR
jgi:surfeit locus 1 family protein